MNATFKPPHLQDFYDQFILLLLLLIANNFPLLCDHNQIHEDEDSHKHLHLQLGSG